MDFYDILYLVAGIFLLIKGADLFVEGSSSIAKFFKIPALIIGLTLVSIGTSLPELSVSVTASLSGNNGVSFGNVIGSNIFNVLVVIGISAIFTPMLVSKSMKKFDIPFLLFIYAMLVLFAFIITPYQLVWYEGVIFLLIFVSYIIFLVIRSIKDNKVEKVEESSNEEDSLKRPMLLNIGYVILGVILIIVGGDLVVEGASNIANSIGSSLCVDKEKLDLLVGLTVVAVGTSLPELVTSMVAAKKGENDIAIGNAIGSCMFNVLLILGVASSISPMVLGSNTYIDIIVMFIAALLIFIFSFKTLKVNKKQGLALVILYVAYLAYTVAIALI